MRNLLSFHKRRKQKKERSYYFHKNGALLMKDLIATFGPRYNLPFRTFSLEELIRITNNFSEQVYAHPLGAFYRGILDDRPVLVHNYRWKSLFEHSYFIRDIVTTSQMSHHKNVLPLIGCCLELEIPASVYDNALDHEFVYELFNPSNNVSGNGNAKVISWRNRIKIAKDISNVLIYLHSAFPTPIIFRDLKASRVAIDRYGVAKLAGFAFSICLPPGELKVRDTVIGTQENLDPEYAMSGFVTEKIDVYGLGTLMLALISGRSSTMVYKWAEERRNPDGDDEDKPGIVGEIRTTIQHYAKHFIKNSRFKEFVDPKIFEEEGQNEHQILEHLLALSNLALRCTESEGKNRPEMIDVAKQLSQINKCDGSLTAVSKLCT